MFTSYTKASLKLFFGPSDQAGMFTNYNGDKLSADKAFDLLKNISSNMGDHVQRFEIPKRKEGKVRVLYAPSGQLKFLHKNLNEYVFSRYRPTDYAHGFVRKRSVLTNALEHTGSRSMCHMDIKNFFDNITKNHVQNVLFGSYFMCAGCKCVGKMKSRLCSPSIYRNLDGQFPELCEELKWFSGQQDEGYESLVDMISSITTYEGFTPQGFATSPFIANIVLRKFDLLVGRRMADRGIKYTRYADDLTFTHAEKGTSAIYRQVHSYVPSILGLFGFKINQSKTYYLSNKGRMAVCNVVINKIPNLKRETQSLIRAKVHHATVKKASTTTRADLHVLKGQLAYFYMLNPKKAKQYMEQIKAFEAQQHLQCDMFEPADPDPGPNPNLEAVPC